MHNNYYFLRQLTGALASRLTGSVVSQCFSQHVDELVLQFETAQGRFFIRASLQPQVCCLSFPDDVKRARKNSIDLFQEIIGCRVTMLNQFMNERSFGIELENNLLLLFKMHGNRANIILFIDLKPVKLFHNQLAQDYSIRPEGLNKSIDFSRTAFEKNLANLQQYYFTFGKPVWQYLATLNFYSKSTEEKWSLFNETIRLLQNPTYFIVKDQNAVHFSLLPVYEVTRSFSDPIMAINEFFMVHHATRTLMHEKQQAIHQLNKKIEQNRSYIDRNTAKLKELEHDNHFSAWADLLMANLTHLQAGAETVTVLNFYTNQPEVIKVKKEFSIQKNAEIFYRKAKNRQLEIQNLKEGLALKQQQVNVLEERLKQVQQADNLRTLRQLIKESNLIKTEKERTIALPYREVEFNGFKIWIGKNAKSNDELTQKYSYKEDLWLHAKDVTGSHVLIKYQAGKPFPKSVIERAAQLAAYHSKRKTDSLCPVTVTPKKFVRKRKGDAPGMVVVEREKVILVEPKQ
ncbi:MAG: NFACT RNA binding domain-containing protein [Cyclobacteriaceae bacterium]|nr:NFACT RNA binding domain-containing protein [Cyclobacteriaceae bacterium]